MAIQLHPTIAVHPGAFLRAEIVAPAGLTVTALAAHFGVTRAALSAVLNGRAALSAEMALRFEQAFGVRADTMMRMQSAYELAQARLHGAVRIERLTEAA
ncbi:HigA family addiction module antitoxin [Sphingomonas sp. RT2P30]|uniref:HigA family addiction module antitoxin n=1 Tax=Parasphingomonas halimpatiens TaxID=3096162 RepID=UPI002FC65236